jgi:hypothetical protein
VANVLLPTADYLDEIAEVENVYSLLTKAHYPLFGLPFWDETAAAIMVDPSIVTDAIECMRFFGLPPRVVRIIDHEAH